MTTLTFCGAAGTVTGSNFLLETGAGKFLVDCGLRQGMDEDKNWEEFGYDPKEVTHLIVTHAHLDHIGRIPLLVRRGFTGRIISTTATKALAEPILEDALELLDRSAERHGRPVLYEAKDLAKTMQLWKGVEYHQPQELGDGVSVELLDAGHILGSAMARLTRGDKSILFTGDLGGGNSPLLGPTEAAGDPTYLVIESTYGDRVRADDAKRVEELENVIEETVARGGTLLIPAFSTERTQDLLFDIRKLMTEKRIPSVPVFLDSPLAQKITESYLAYPTYFSPEIRARVEGGEDIFRFPELRFVERAEESRRIVETRGPKIVLAGSGMSSGGRVIAHEREFLPDAHSTMLIVGYQAAGTLGRQLVEGVKNLVLHNKDTIPVRAKVQTLYGYSAHRDGESLLEFVNACSGTAQEVFVVHGEPAASSFLTQRIRDYLGLKASAPEAGDKAELEF